MIRYIAPSGLRKFIGSHTQHSASLHVGLRVHRPFGTKFNGSNLTASANDLEWNGKKWSIVNHFIPYTEKEVNAPDRFESDFMVQYMRGKKFSKEVNVVLAEGKKLWQAYFAHTDVHTVREELKLNRPDVGWYQIRKALQARNESGDFPPVSFKAFESAYKSLTEKLQPMVYELGFLKA
jgi:hypothetical protein